jgi:hypothetical protein
MLWWIGCCFNIIGIFFPPIFVFHHQLNLKIKQIHLIAFARVVGLGDPVKHQTTTTKLKTPT